MDDSWTWNQDSTNAPSYYNWAEGEPNVNPSADTNYVQIQQDDESFTGTWFVPDDQTDANYYICQSPKIPRSQITSTTTPSSDKTTDTTTPFEDMVCMSGYDDLVFNSGKCYYISLGDDTMSWYDAMATCSEMLNWDYNIEYNSENTQLVSINSQDENDQLFDQVSIFGIESVWIGLSWNGKTNNKCNLKL